MSRPDLRITSLLMAAAVVGSLGMEPVVIAQDDEDEPAPKAPPPRALVVNRIPIDQWIFRGIGNAQIARDKLDAILTLEVDELERTCRLSPTQKKKLLLAGQVDIKRFFDRVEELRKKSEPSQNDPNQLRVILQEAQPLMKIYQEGLLGEDSMFAKTLKRTLSEEQVASQEAGVRDRLLYRYWAKVDLALQVLNNTIGFTAEQCHRLRELLEEETRPPKKLGQDDYLAVLYQISQIPEVKLRPIFDEGQWGFLKRQLTQARDMAQWLKQKGFVPDDPPAGSKPESLSKSTKHQR